MTLLQNLGSRAFIHHDRYARFRLIPLAARTLFLKEVREFLVSPRSRVRVLCFATALSVLAVLFVADTGLKLKGTAQALSAMLTATAVLGALVALLTGIDAIAGERARGSLVPLLLTPLSRAAIATGKLGAPLAASMAIPVLSLPYLWAMGPGQGFGTLAAALLLFGTPLILSFGFLGLGLGAHFRSSRSAQGLALAAILFSASPLAASQRLHGTIAGIFIDHVNPLSCAVNTLRAIVVKGEAIAAQGLYVIPLALFFILSLFFAISSVRTLVPEEGWPLQACKTET